MVYLKRDKSGFYKYRTFREGKIVRTEYLGKATFWELVKFFLIGKVKKLPRIYSDKQNMEIKS